MDRTRSSVAFEQTSDAPNDIEGDQVVNNPPILPSNAPVVRSSRVINVAYKRKQQRGKVRAQVEKEVVTEKDATVDAYEVAITSLSPIVEITETPYTSNQKEVDVSAQASQTPIMGQGTSGEPSTRARRTGEACKGLNDIIDCDTDVEVDIDVMLKEGWKSHVAYGIWKQTEDRGIISFKQFTTSVGLWELKKESDEFQTLVKASPLYILVDAPYITANRHLVCGFLERWHSETNTFYLLDLVEQEFKHCKGSKLSKCWLKTHLSGKSGRNGISVEQGVRGYLLYLIGCTIVCDRTGDKIKISYLEMLRDLDKVHEWAWGAAALANLYHQLSKATRMKST